MGTFAENLRTSRKTRRLSQTALAEHVHVSQHAVSTWELGLAKPSADTLQALAEFFGVTIDDLVGRTGDSSTEPAAPITPQPAFGTAQSSRRFTDRLRMAREAKNLTQGDVARAVGVARNLVSRWEIGDRKPQGDALVKLADLFGVTTDYLLGRCDTPATNLSPPVAASAGEEPDRLARAAEELSAALKMREENERLRIETVDAVRAQADRLAQENLRMLMMHLIDAPRDSGQRGGDEEPEAGAAQTESNRVEGA